MNTDIIVILVDESDNQIGVLEKHEAHRKAMLHRAVSVFLFNSKGEWILQQRAFTKYHSKGLWTNTCCTHPYPNESNIDAAKRRLKEEMGIDPKNLDLEEIFSFVYKEKLDDEFTEYEFDHVFIGKSDKEPLINPDEVHSWKAISFNELSKDINENPDKYTVWFKLIFERVFHSLKSN